MVADRGQYTQNMPTYMGGRFLFVSFQSGCLILLVFDERYENYLVLSSGPTLHFLHPESLAVLDIATSNVLFIIIIIIIIIISNSIIVLIVNITYIDIIL